MVVTLKLITPIIIFFSLTLPFVPERFGVSGRELAKYFFIGAVILVFGVQLYWSQAQYFLWYSAGPPSLYFLPPYAPISYFIGYVFHRLFLKHLLSLAAALVFLAAAKYLNRKAGERFFFAEEFYWGAFSVFALGQPLWIYYLPFLLGAGTAVLLYNALVRRDYGRFSLYYLWLPSAAIVYLANSFNFL